MRLVHRRRSKARLPWKRGPVAWRIAEQGVEILDRISQCRKSFLSLRSSARLLGVSTQPLRDWTKRGDLNRDGWRLQYSKQELNRFVRLLMDRAEPFDPENYLLRFGEELRYPFRKIARSEFIWPIGRDALTPRELASLTGCHASLILMAIKAGKVRAKFRSPCRREITKRAWEDAFPRTIPLTLRFPPLARKEILTTNEVAAYLAECGMPKASQRKV